jgi:hypothetical protein
LLTNSFKPDYAAGVSLAGKSGATSWYLGGFANDPDEEFGNFDGGWSVIAGVDQDIKDIVGTDKASVGFGYIHSDRNESDTIFTSIDDGLSLRGSIKQGALGVSAEALYLMGDNDRYGISVTPTYDITKQLQFVARYQLAASDSDSGLGAQK